MEDLDLQLEAFATRLRKRLKRDFLIVAIAPLAIGLGAGVLVGRASAPAPKAQVIACQQPAKNSGVFFLGADGDGFKMKIEGYGD